MTDPAAPARPRDVEVGFRAWLASAAVSLVGQLLGLPTADEAIRRARAATAPGDRPMTPAEMASAAQVGQVVGVVVMLVVTALVVLIGVKMRAGRNWARLAMAVVTVLDVVFLVLGPRSSGAAELIAGGVSALLAAGAVALLFRPVAGAYFASGRAVPGP